jgi:hypothetical protein
MVQVSELIAELQALKERWGDTCVYITGLSWGAVALNHQAADEANRPHWERSKNRHGYWIGLQRFGYIGLVLGKTKYRYEWIFESPDGMEVEGKSTNLRLAKQSVERLFERYFPQGWSKGLGN